MLEALFLALTLSGPIQADVVRVLDGDTIKVNAYIWIDTTKEINIRVRGIDAPELQGPSLCEKDLARLSKMVAEQLLKEGAVTLGRIEKDKYGGRVVADVTLADGRDFGKEMIKAWAAHPYNGAQRAAWCDK